MEIIAAIFSQMPDKDKFLREHEHLTMFRLINETSVSRYLEETLLSRFQKYSGLDNISRLKNTLIDVDTSAQMLIDFRNYMA